MLCAVCMMADESERDAVSILYGVSVCKLHLFRLSGEVVATGRTVRQFLLDETVPIERVDGDI